MVGTSGSSGERLGDAIASGRRAPLLKCCMLLELGIQITFTCPPSAAATDCATPLYGTNVMSRPARFFNCSPSTCIGEPLSPAAYGNPGCFLASATSSATLPALNLPFTASTISVATGIETGARSVSTLMVEAPEDST